MLLSFSSFSTFHRQGWYMRYYNEKIAAIAHYYFDIIAIACYFDILEVRSIICLLARA